MPDEAPITPALKLKKKSWTLWFFGALAIASAVLQQLDVILPETAWVGTLSGIIGVLLRLKTTSPVL